VVLNVEPERLAKGRNFEGACDSHIVLGVGVNDVSAACQNERGLCLDPTNMFADEKKGLQSFSEALVTLDSTSGIAIWILVPVVTGLVARLADIERIHPNPKLRSRIEHEREVVTHGLSDSKHIRASRALSPRVNPRRRS